MRATCSCRRVTSGALRRRAGGRLRTWEVAANQCVHRAAPTPPAGTVTGGCAMARQCWSHVSAVWGQRGTTVPNVPSSLDAAAPDRHVVASQDGRRLHGRSPRSGVDPAVAVRVGVHVAGNSGFPEQHQPGTACQPWSCLGTDSACARPRPRLNEDHNTVTRPSRHSGMVTRRASTLRRSHSEGRRSLVQRPAPRPSL